MLGSKIKLSNRRGLASLPAILLLGGIIVEISVAGLLLLFYLNNSVYGSRIADEALAVAQSGINDAVMQIILDKDAEFSGYSLGVGNGTATTDVSIVVVSGKRIITTTGIVFTRERTLEATVTVDDVTGIVTIDSVKEL